MMTIEERIARLERIVAIASGYDAPEGSCPDDVHRAWGELQELRVEVEARRES